MSDATERTIPADPFQRAEASFDDLVAGLPLPGRDSDEASVVESLGATVRRFGKSSIDSSAIEREHRIPRRVLDEAAQLGLLGLTTPPEYGGAGLSLQASCSVIEQLSRFDRSVATSIGLHNGLGLRGLVRYGGAHLKDRYLPDLAAGKRIAAFGATEANAGSDLAAIRTSALPDPADADRLRLNGEKVFITNAGFADVFTVVAYTPGMGGKKKGHSLVLVPRATDGFSVGREEEKLGLRGSSTATLIFENASVPADHVIGEPGKGVVLMHRVLAWGRTLMAGGCLGGAGASLELAVRHVTTRKQFGRALSEFELVRQQVARERARLYLAESLVRAAARMCDRLEEGAAWETAAAKVLSSESAWQVIDASLQLHGGAGFIEDTGVARALRDCRVTRIFEGANDLLRMSLATEAMTWPTAQIGGLAPIGPRLSAPLRDCAAQVEADRAELVASIGELRREHGMKVVERQAALARIGDMAVFLYASLATLLRTEGAVRSAGTAAPEVDLAVAACEEAHQAFQATSERLKRNADSACDRIARREYERVEP
jgi:alkylation response protein AidB-like acyl-CoA dehydrogenase